MLRAGLWALLGQAGQQLVGLIIVVVLARILTPTEYGVVAAAQLVFALAQVVVDFGIGATLIQTPHLTMQLQRTALTMMLGFAAAIVAIIGLATPVLAHLMNVPELVTVMPFMLVTLVFASINNPSLSLLTRDMRFKLLSGINTFTLTFVHAVIAISLALSGWSYWSVILATLASTVAKTVIVHFCRPVLPTFDIRWSDVKKLSGFGTGMFLSQFFAQVGQRVDYIIVSAVLGAAPLGYYSRAYKLMDVSNSLIGTAFRSTLFAGFSKKRRTKSATASASDSLLLAHVFSALIGVPMAALMMILAPEIVWLLLGDKWAPVIPVLQVFAIGVVFRLAIKVSNSFNVAEGAVYAAALRGLIYAILVGLGAWIGVRYGLTFVAMGVLGALVTHFFLLTQLALSSCEVAWPRLIRALAPVLGAGVLSGLVVSWVAGALRASGAGTLTVLFISSLLYVALFASSLTPFLKTGVFPRIAVRLQDLIKTRPSA